MVKENNIHRLDWPTQSPDINPIEHVWKRLKKQFSTIKSKNLDELRKNIEKEFKEIDKNFIHELILSMPRRIQALIKAKGGHTKY